jgi:hypothetical protein
MFACFESPVGVIKMTHNDLIPDHHTWWIPKTCCEPWNLFVDYEDAV